MKLEIRYDRVTLTTAAVRFDEFPNALRADLLVAINDLAAEAFARVAARVPRRTGRLAAQEQIDLKNEPDKVSATVNFDGGGAVGNDFAKGGALEYGSTGERFDVKSYTQSRTAAFGRALNAPHETMVRAYQRPGAIAAQAFTRPVFDAMKGPALARINDVAIKAIARANGDSVA